MYFLSFYVCACAFVCFCAFLLHHDQTDDVLSNNSSAFSGRMVKKVLHASWELRVEGRLMEEVMDEFLDILLSFYLLRICFMFVLGLQIDLFNRD